MQYYRFEGMHQDAGWLGEGEEEKLLRARRCTIAGHTQGFNASLDGKAYFFVAVLTTTTVTIGAMMKEKIHLNKNLTAFQKSIGLNMKETFRKETTLAGVSTFE